MGGNTKKTGNQKTNKSKEDAKMQEDEPQKLSQVKNLKKVEDNKNSRSNSKEPQQGKLDQKKPEQKRGVSSNSKVGQQQKVIEDESNERTGRQKKAESPANAKKNNKSKNQEINEQTLKQQKLTEVVKAPSIEKKGQKSQAPNVEEKKTSSREVKRKNSDAKMNEKDAAKKEEIKANPKKQRSVTKEPSPTKSKSKSKSSQFIPGDYKGSIPKKPITAYFYFLNHSAPKIKEEFQLNQKQTVSKVAEIWNKMTDQEKDRYVQESKKDQQRYEAQLNSIKEKGYFIMSDGTKSNEVIQDDQKRKRAKSSVTPLKQQKIPDKRTANSKSNTKAITKKQPQVVKTQVKMSKKEDIIMKE